MNEDDIEKLIRIKVAGNEYEIKLHALQRINERGVLPAEVKEALLACKVIENYPEDKRGHSCLVSGTTVEGRSLHLVCGLTSDILWIITVYEPDPVEWETPYERRITR